MINMNIRLEKLRSKFDELEIDGLLVTDGINRRYLSGFSGSAGLLLITAGEAILFTDSRYSERAEQEVDGLLVYKPQKEKDGEGKNKKLIDFMAEELFRLGVKTLGFESLSVYYYFYKQLEEKLPSIILKPTENLVEEIREIKSSEEIESIKKAAAIADEAFILAMDYLVPGVRECDIRAHMNYFIQTLGGFNECFDIIIASGPNGAIPHAKTSSKVIEEGELIVMDFGADYNGFCSDCTRTLIMGEADERQSYIYKLVKTAQEEALKIVKPGVKCSEVDKAVRDLFEKEGYSKEFIHSTGHSVGLQVHEKPSIAPASEAILQPGMVITVEPGLYFSGWGGVRIEDLIVINEQGFDFITKAPYDLKKK